MVGFCHLTDSHHYHHGQKPTMVGICHGGNLLGNQEKERERKRKKEKEKTLIHKDWTNCCKSYSLTSNCSIIKSNWWNIVWLKSVSFTTDSLNSFIPIRNYLQGEKLNIGNKTATFSSVCQSESWWQLLSQVGNPNCWKCEEKIPLEWCRMESK